MEQQDSRTPKEKRSKKRSSDYDRKSVLPPNWTPSPDRHVDIGPEGNADGADRSTNQSVDVDICARLSQQSIGADDA